MAPRLQEDDLFVHDFFFLPPHISAAEYRRIILIGKSTLRSSEMFPLSKIRRDPFLLFVKVFAVLVLFHDFISAIHAIGDDNIVNIGAIIDAGSRFGREEKTAMELAVLKFNNSTRNHKLVLHLHDSQGDPLRAASAADNLINGERADVIVGMNRWEEAALVAEASNRAKVPVLSFSSPPTSPPSPEYRWPFLIRMASSRVAEMSCVAALVRSYGWRRVIVINEDDNLGTGDSGTVSLLSAALQDADAEIEHRLVLPPASSVSDHASVLQEAIKNLQTKQSRVFVVLRLSPILTAYLFAQAKELGLMSTDSAWIITDAVTSFLHSVNASVIVSMSGALGIQSHYTSNGLYPDFSNQFQAAFRREYLDEDKFQPGLAAFRAYDCIATISRAVARFHGENHKIDSETLMKYIKSSNFTGLSDEIRFSNGELDQIRRFRVVNFVGNGYKELGFWSSGNGFSKENNREEKLTGLVNWPGDLQRVPKGWAMPTTRKRLQIIVPGRTSFEKFVKVESSEITGFCISVFEEAVRIIEKHYEVPYDLHPCYCSYDELIDLVYNKTYDAAVGDITILEDRLDKVEFTQPYAESGLRMIVPVKTETQTPWIFMKPFTAGMWIATGAMLAYTMFVVWFLEHRNNSNFRGSWRDQLGTTLWFTFSSLFFAHKEKINSNFTRVVVTVWLFLVFILTASYTASLSSMLTVQRLAPNVTDINWIRSTGQKVGCDGDSFVLKYIQDVLRLKPGNIKKVDNEYKYDGAFIYQNITAAFLEAPYATAFLNQYCRGYTITTPAYRFGGLAFAFQKGSPIVHDLSRAILQMLEDGTLEDIQAHWFAPTSECLAARNASDNQSLSLKSFWGLYLISGATSTICFAIFIVHLLKNFHHRREEILSPMDTSVWIKAKRLAQYFHDKNFTTPSSASIAQSSDDEAVVADHHRHPSPDSPPLEVPEPFTQVAATGMLFQTWMMKHVLPSYLAK